MVKVCCVKGCSSESFANCGISFHSFPKNENLRAKWLDALGGDPTCKNPVVCSRHFKKEHFKPTVLPRLTDDAVPFVVPPTKRIAVLSDISLQVTNDAVPGVVPPTKKIAVLSDISPQITQRSCESRPNTSFQENIDVPSKSCAKLPRLNIIDAGTQTTSLPSPKEETLKKKVRSLHQKLLRRDLKIENMKNLLDVLKTKCRIEL